MKSHAASLAALIVITACSTSRQPTTAATPKDSLPPTGRGAVSTPNDDPFPSTYVRFPSAPVVIRNVNIMTAAGPTIQNGMIALADGKIVAVGQTVAVPQGATVIDAVGKYVTPGIIDTHSHVGVYAAPGGQALSDGNEATNPVT